MRQRPLEATYLAWLDVRALGHADPAGLALREGRVLVNDGARFGPGGQGHVRVNLATSPERLERIVRQLATAWTEAAGAMSAAPRRSRHRGGVPTTERHCP